MTESLSPLVVDVQFALSADDETSEVDEPPSASTLTEWANRAYAGLCRGPSEVTIRLVDETEIRTLNRDYRGKDSRTNVLSFPVDLDELDLLGDVVICHRVIVDEAHVQAKSLDHHYAHMVTHGLLHLCGYDHETTADAEQMEALEIDILATQGIANPYA